MQSDVKIIVGLVLILITIHKLHASLLKVFVHFGCRYWMIWSFRLPLDESFCFFFSSNDMISSGPFSRIFLFFLQNPKSPTTKNKTCTKKKKWWKTFEGVGVKSETYMDENCCFIHYKDEKVWYIKENMQINPIYYVFIRYYSYVTPKYIHISYTSNMKMICYNV